MSSLPKRETVETDRQHCVHVYPCCFVCVCGVCGVCECVWCVVCIPTVRLRPAAERGSANIQTLNTLHCTTAAAAAAGLLSYV